MSGRGLPAWTQARHGHGPPDLPMPLRDPRLQGHSGAHRHPPAARVRVQGTHAVSPGLTSPTCLRTGLCPNAMVLSKASGPPVSDPQNQAAGLKPHPVQAPRLLPRDLWGSSAGGVGASWSESRALEQAPCSSQTQMLLHSPQENPQAPTLSLSG